MNVKKLKKSVLDVGLGIWNELDSLLEQGNALRDPLFIESEIYKSSLKFLEGYDSKCSLVLLSIKLGYYEGCEDV